MNPGIDCTKLEIGQVIRLPSMRKCHKRSLFFTRKKTNFCLIVSQAETQNTIEKHSQIINHTVFAGDTLERIAEWYHCTINDLIQLNPAIQPNLLYPGQQIQLPCNERTKDCREN